MMREGLMKNEELQVLSTGTEEVHMTFFIALSSMLIDLL